MGSRQVAVDASHLVFVLIMSGFFGLCYFGLLWYCGIPFAYAVVLDGGLITLFFMENVALMADLEKKLDPDKALVESDKMQRETIKKLSNQRAVLQKQVLDLEAVLKRKKWIKNALSKSCDNLYNISNA